jgi:hypothetical protein
VRLKGLGQLKNSMISTEIEPVTYQLVRPKCSLISHMSHAFYIPRLCHLPLMPLRVVCGEEALYKSRIVLVRSFLQAPVRLPVSPPKITSTLDEGEESSLPPGRFVWTGGWMEH